MKAGRCRRERKSGWGTIPNGDFDVHGASGNADLSTDLSNVQAYAYGYSCDYDTWSCSFTELPPPSGPLSVSWHKKPFYSQSYDGRYTSDYLNYKYVSQGHEVYASADVVGTIHRSTYRERPCSLTMSKAGGWSGASRDPCSSWTSSPRASLMSPPPSRY